jgi:uncharacterized membrane protein YphA (DoxX/SURF4 family)
MRRKILEILFIVVRIAIGGIFIVSSIPKLRQPYDFLASVYSYEIVGPMFGLGVAIILPWVELFAGICLVGGIFVSGALLVSICLCLIFSFVLASALFSGLDISCGCFGSADGTVISYWSLIRALVLLLASVAVYSYPVFIPKKIEIRMKK